MPVQSLHVRDVDVLVISDFLELVLVLVSIGFTMTQRFMQNQKWEKFRNLVDLAVKL